MILTFGRVLRCAFGENHGRPVRVPHPGKIPQPNKHALASAGLHFVPRLGHSLSRELIDMKAQIMAWVDTPSPLSELRVSARMMQGDARRPSPDAQLHAENGDSALFVADQIFGERPNIQLNEDGRHLGLRA